MRFHRKVTIEKIELYKTIFRTLVAKHHRTKRGIFNGGGRVFKSLFGTATESDIAKLQNEIIAIENGFDNSTKGFGAALDSLNSLEVHVDKRVSNIQTGLNYTSRMLNLTLRNFKVLSNFANETEHEVSRLRFQTKTIVQITNLLHTMSITYGHNLDLLLSQIQIKVHAAMELIRGQIPVSLVPSNLILQAMISIKEHLSG